MRGWAAMSGVLFLALPASATEWSDLDRMEFANSAGTLLASEEPCGLTFDPSAVRALITDNVPAGDLEFASMLRTMTQGRRAMIEGMADSQLVAHCASVEQNARHYRLIQ